MAQLRKRIGVMVARVRSGEGAHVLADLAETAEHWLKSETLPRPLRPPAERLGSAVGDLGRAYRPPPSEIPPPEEHLEAEGAMPAVTRAHEAAARTNGKSEKKTSKPRAKPSKGKASEAPKARPSARRSAPKKRVEPVEPPTEPKAERKSQRKTNGKGRPKRPSARRTRNGKNQKPT